jgi:hypothetical protein
MLAGSFHRKLLGIAAVLVFQGALTAETSWYHGSCINATYKTAFVKCEKIFFTFIYSAKEFFTN